MDTDVFRDIIRGRIVELESESRASRESRDPVALDQARQGRLSRMDAMQGQAMAQAAEVRRRLQVERLRGALARIEAGDFGDCGACRQPIGEARLRADPAATRCIECAASEDTGGA